MHVESTLQKQDIPFFVEGILPTHATYNVMSPL